MIEDVVLMLELEDLVVVLPHSKLCLGRRSGGALLQFCNLYVHFLSLEVYKALE